MDYQRIHLHYDPCPTLLEADDRALVHFVRRDLLNETVPPAESLWEFPEPQRLVKRQQTDGSWKYGSKSYDPDTSQNYDLLETFRNLRILIEKYGFDRSHPVIEQASAYVFSCQTDEGDIRGILGNQYMPYYHGAILELLIKAGYQEDANVKLGMEWLLLMQQDDGGWIVPMQAIPPKDRTPEVWRGPALSHDRSLPHSHLATGMVLRAFAEHSEYRNHRLIQKAGEALKSRLLKADKYNDRKARSYWLKFQFPFWWGNLLTALDSLSKLGFGTDDDAITTGLHWFQEQQEPDGLWPTGYDRGSKARSNQLWVGLAICRILTHFAKVSSTQ